jgi:hypothetical protein
VHQDLPQPSPVGQLERVRTESSFLRLVWPFEIGRAGDRSHYERLVHGVQAAVNPEGGRLWQELDLPVDMLLTHCAAHLNCWDGTPDDPVRNHETGHFWRIEKSNRASGAIFDPKREWRARQGSGAKAQSASFFVTDVNLVIFRQRVGFVVLEIVSRSSDPADWLFLANRLRTLGGSGHRQSRSGAVIEVDASPALPFFMPVGEVGQDEAKKCSGSLGDVFEWVARDSLPDSDLSHPWVRDQALPYFSLFVDSVNDVSDGEDESPAGVADLGERVRRFFRADQSLQATDEDLSSTVITYAPDQYFSYSLDGGSFYARDAPDTEFFHRTLPDHLRRYYFLNYLFALHQRLVLMQLSDAIADRWVEAPSALDPSAGTSDAAASADEASKARVGSLVRAFEELRDELLEFSARGYFIQFMYSQNHHRDYRKWQEIFEVADFHREVQSQLHEIYAALSLRFEDIASRRRQRVEKLERRKTATQTSFTYILAIFGVVSLVLAFLGVPIKGETQNGIDFWKLFSYGVIAAVVGVTIAYLVHREIVRRGPPE